MDRYIKIAVVQALARAGREISALEISDKLPYRMADVCEAIGEAIKDGLIQPGGVGEYGITERGARIALGEE